MINAKLVAALAILASGGLVAFQYHKVTHPAPTAPAAAKVCIDETLRLAESLRTPTEFPAPGITPHRIDDLIDHAPVSVARDPIVVPSNTSRHAAAPGASKKSPPVAKRTTKGTPQRSASAPGIRRPTATSTFKKTQSSLSSALSKNYFTKPQFGFSGVVKKTTRGKMVSRTKNN